MSAPVFHPGPLTAELVARALVAACAEYGFDPQTAYAPIRDGRGRARLLAAAALVHPADRPPAKCAKVMAVHIVHMSPSGLAGRKVYADAIAKVRAVLVGAPAAPALSVEAKTRRGEPGWINPIRDLEREKRIIAARKAGVGPRDIARAEGLSLSATKRILADCGEVLPEVKPGPRRGGRVARPKPVAEAKARAPRRPREPKSVAPRAAVPAAVPTPVVPPAPVEEFPADHAAWAPLPGTTPVRLIDHTQGCRWPVTVVGARDPMVCDAAIQIGTPYCGRHHWLSLAPAARARLGLTSPVPVSAPRMARPFRSADLKDDAA